MSQYNVSKMKVAEGNRPLAAIAYIIPLVGGFVALSQDDELAKNHGRQSIGVLVAALFILVVWAIAAYLVSFLPLFGPIIATATFALVLAFLLFFVLTWFLGFVSALRGYKTRIPLASRAANRVFGPPI